MLELDRGKAPLILIVDDTAQDLAIISGVLRPLGANVITERSAVKALATAKTSPTPDIILLDIMMPVMDGHEVLAELRRDPLTADIPVIFVTSDRSESEEVRGLSEGAADFITKPIHATILQARVRAQLELAHARQLQTRQKEWLEQEVIRRVAENMKLEARLQLALDSSGLGVWEYNHKTTQYHWSQSLCTLLGHESAPAGIADYLDLVHPEDRPAVENQLKSALHQGTTLHIAEYRIRRGDGTWLWVETRGRVMLGDSDGHPLLTTGTMTDISQRKLADADRALSAAVLAGIENGICVTDTQGRTLLVNDAFCRISGYTSEELTGQPLSLLHSGGHGAPFYKAMWKRISETGSWQGEITNRRKDGELVTEWLTISAVRDATGQPTSYIGIYSDLVGRKAADSRIQYLSSYDPLTDLPNRNLLTDRLAQALLIAQRFQRAVAFITLDIDHFHVINETLGPAAGDQVLIEAARRLSLQVREGDTLGRQSGNEFAFVMASMGHEHDVLMLTQRIQEAMAVPLEIAGQSLTLTTCVGVGIFPRDGSDAEALMKGAAIALIRAKAAGRSSLRFYSPQMEADALRRATLENLLRGALERNELHVVYQPQISLDSGNLLGMEALLRWHSPEFGEISPLEFIPIAEESGLIIPIGEWVLRTACAQTRRWHDHGWQQLRVAVNLSPRQFRDSNLLGMARNALADSGLAASALELEITESAVIDKIDDAVGICRELKLLGIRLSLDDFGTGYSSLAYISRFPFDKLKIDQSFVRDIVENPVNAAIATAAIVLARSLNLTVLAEGVETEAQARFLRSRHCDAMQGFLYSPPLDDGRFTTLLAGDRRLELPSSGDEEPPTLLLVDDEPFILASISRLLRREGYLILTAGSTGEAFDLLAKHVVHVIVSDQRMPDMSGTEFFSRVRQLYPETQRLILTGYTDLESVTDAINRGAVAKFLTKPWDDDQLREHIRTAFRIIRDREQTEETPPDVEVR